MEFAYTIATRDGATQKGTLEAASARGAVASLRAQGFVVLALEEKKAERALSKALRSRFTRFPMTQRVFFARHLALILRAGIPIDRALDILSKQERNKSVRRVLQEMLALVQRGESFSATLARFPKMFSPLFVSIVRWGEIGGTLVESLEHLASQLEKDHDLRVKVRSAFIYPVIVIGATFALGVVMAVFILPRLVGLFDALRVDLPFTTRVFLAVSRLLLQYGVIFIVVTPVVIIGGIAVVRAKFSRPLVHRMLLRLPVFGTLTKQVNLARFDRILGSLIRSGIPIVEALDITSQSLGNLLFQRALLQLKNTAREGVPLGQEIGRYPLFPPIQAQMIVVGESTGRLADVLLYLAEFTERDVDTRTKNLAVAVEPMLLIFIGVIVGGVAISVITPIYQLVGSFSR